MKKILKPILLVCLAALGASAQTVKEIPQTNLTPGQTPNLNIRAWNTPAVPPADNPFGAAAPDFKPLLTSPGVKVTMGNEGLPIFFEGTTAASAGPVEEQTAGRAALAYLESLHPPGILDPAVEFAVKSVQTDKRRGDFHVRLEQHFHGIPVFGAELVAHTKGGVFASAAGRYAPTPALQSVQPQISSEAAIQRAVEAIGTDKMKKDWSAADLELIGGQPLRSQLVIYRLNNESREARLAWKVEAHPSLTATLFYFVDAASGEVLHFFNAACNFAGPHTAHACRGEAAPVHETVSGFPGKNAFLPPPPPPVTGSGIDLAGVNRSFGAWQHSDGLYYLVDASKPMYNGDDASVPNGTMEGVIVTRDQNNVLNGPVSHITSGSAVFDNPNAVSAHANTGICYDYYKNTFDRNSINGTGGTINVVVNVPDENGAMDNAYWNGSAMYWGNGNTIFTPLAKSLDVAGHEMTHGVVENTAGLIYEGESGALNESFADIFAVMIDRDDWGIGEGIFQPGQSPTGLLRDFIDPHNGDGDFWQPSHYSERYAGAEDNGGVHANSGITNHAFYLFATNPAVGKATAEQVYYYTLRDRLTASSRFVDLRLAVIAEATANYSTEVANAAAAAFDAVGITTGPPTSLAPSLSPGTGQEYILSVTDDGQNLQISEADGTLLSTLYEEGVLNKPSVTDNGEKIVFINNEHQIMGCEVAYNNGSLQFNIGVVSEDSTWRNAAISKDGRFLAALTTLNDNKVILFDLADPLGPTPREYFLVNPTFVQGVPWVDNVAYADVLEFDYSGTQLIYDAYSVIENEQGEDISHWDIGLLEFWKDGQYASNDTPSIRKLVTNLPEHVGVADPAFAKNSPYLIAFDYYIERPNGGVEYRTYVSNIETGENGPAVSNGTVLGYPCFTTHDDMILFQDAALIGGNNLRVQHLAPGSIDPQGTPTNVILGSKWGTWLNNSARDLSVGTQDVQAAGALRFSVAPNPTAGAALISLSQAHAGQAQLEVVDLMGQTLLRRSVYLSEGDNQINLDLRSLPTGAYVVRILSDAGQSVSKLVKE